MPRFHRPAGNDRRRDGDTLFTGVGKGEFAVDNIAVFQRNGLGKQERTLRNLQQPGRSHRTVALFFDAQNTFDTTYFENINLIKALNKLSSEELELIELTILKGYQDRELARQMEIKENTLTRRKNRILAKIKKFLEE